MAWDDPAVGIVWFPRCPGISLGRNTEVNSTKAAFDVGSTIFRIVASGMPRLSTRLSETSVPTTLIKTTTAQYTAGTYAFLKEAGIE